MPNETGADAVIVGAGVMGLSLAWHLRKLGARRVLVLDQRFAGSGASSRNAGRVRSMQLTAELTELAVLAQRKHERLADELGANTLFWRAGYLWVLYGEDERAYIETLMPMLNRTGSPARLLEKKETLRRAPFLDGGEEPAGALWGPDAVVHHDAVLFALRGALHQVGATLLENTRVTAILTEGKAIAGVETDRGVFKTSVVVNAAGAWSRSVSEMVGLRVPNTPLRREALVTESARPFMSDAVTIYRPIEGWFNQTLRGELVVGVLAEEEAPGINLRSSPELLNRAACFMMQKAPRLTGLRVVRQWAGLYDVTPDRMPVIGPVAGVDGFFQANGDSGRGFALSPILAEMLATWIMKGERNPLLGAFDAIRFDGHDHDLGMSKDYYSGYRARA